VRRIQRFFTEFSIDFEVIARLLVAIIPIKGPYQLSLDRTKSSATPMEVCGS